MWDCISGITWEQLSYIATALGIPFAVGQYTFSKRREAREREEKVFNTTNEMYLRYMDICLQNIDLDIFDIKDQNPGKLSQEQRKREIICFTILFSVFEHAFLTYAHSSEKSRMRQWEGCERYIETFCRRENFVEAWRKSGHQVDGAFDREFEKYIELKIKEASAKS